MSSFDDLKNVMKPQIAEARAKAGQTAQRIRESRTAERISHWPKGRLIGAGIALAVVLFLAVNVISNNVLRTSRVDLTEQSLFSLTDGTRELLSGLEEPLHLRLFLSDELLQSAPQLAAYANRVRAMLATYASLSNGKITLEVIDPEPFSDDEDRAVGFGINRIRLSGADQELFFGLAATNSTDGQAQIPVFSPDREAFLEYDLTRMIAELGQPQKPVIAVVDGIGLSGNPRARQPEQQILAQLREMFEVEQLSGDVDQLPEGTRVVLIAHPKRLSERTLFTIDQWVLGGGATMVFLDPYAELQPGLRPGMPPANPQSEFDKLLTAWGVGFDSSKAVGDPATALKVARDVGGRQVQAANLAWMAVNRDGMATDDALLAQLSTIIMTTAGRLTTTGEGTKLDPLMFGSDEAGLIDSSLAGAPNSDPRMLYTQLEALDERPVVAARLTGTFETAFPDGKPEGSEAEGEVRTTLDGKPQVVLVADADMLMDRNWIQQRNVFGQRLAQAFANNGAFVLNTVEQMVGGVALADLRGRGVSYRPFEKIQELEKNAEQQYLAEQQKLTEKLRETEQQIAEISQRAGQDGAFIDTESEAAIARFRSELLATRAQLRNVQYELRREVDSLQSWIIALNAGILPALVAALALVFAFRRPNRPLPEPEPDDGAADGDATAADADDDARVTTST